MRESVGEKRWVSCLSVFLFGLLFVFVFFFNDTATTAIYTLSLHDALPIFSGYDHSRTPYSYDPQQAQQLLNEAGFPDGFSMELWQSQSSGLTQVMEAFQSYWKAVGIEVKIVRNDWNMFKSAIREGKPDAYYLDWFADYPDGENFLFPLFHSSESMTKRNRYSNLEVDRRIEEIQSMPDSPDRNRLLIEVDRMTYDEIGRASCRERG